MKLRPVTPEKYARGTAFVTRARGCVLEEIRTPIYSTTPESDALWALRRKLKLSLGEVASRIGVGAIEVSGLERGRLAPEEWGDWTKMIDKIQASRR